MALTLDGDNGISGINGSAATPAVQGTDTNTGLTFGTDTVGIVTGGTTALTVDSSQRVGIGTASPGDYYLSEFVTYGGDGHGITIASSSTSADGRIYFADGTTGDARYRGEIAYSHSTDSLTFNTAAATRMRITSDGYIVNSTNYSADGYTDSNFYIYDDRSGGHSGTFVNNNTSYAQGNHGVLWSGCSRSASSAYVLFAATSGGGSSLSYGSDYEFRLYGDGNGKCDGSWTGGGADYAEMFEWVDGNPDAEDRRGLSVVLEGNKIRAAVDGEDPIGVISANPTILGDAGWNKWTEKHLRDDFGSYVLEEHNVIEWTDEEGKKHSYEDWSIPADVVVPDDAITTTHDENGKRFSHRALNPAYDPDQEYIPREERQEWDAVGLMGKLRIRKGQVTGTRWIKMRDVSDTVEEWLVR